MRPCRSAAASRRCEEEGSDERSCRDKGRGDQRSAVTKGAAEEGGGGMGNEERSCMEWVSTMEMELPEGKARRP